MTSPLKLLFCCSGRFDLDVGLPERAPLGGSESGLVYLARQMAENGHDVTLAARLPLGCPELLMKVRHVPLAALNSPEFFAGGDFGAIIALSAPAAMPHLKSMAPQALLVCWLHQLPRDPAMQPLLAMRPYIDCALFVSHTQAAMFRYPGASAVIGNGIAPAFENMFSSAEDLLAAKEDRAAYTSMPYRGLHLLVDVITRMRGGTQFDVYSAMRTYRMSEENFTELYARVKAAPRTRYHGSLPQPILARELRSAAYLSYPCVFVETYCIAAVEAIAAGLKVVSIEIGSLPETMLGFADLMPVVTEMTHEQAAALYSGLLEKNAASFRKNPKEWAQARFEQSQEVNRICSWRARATEWERLLTSGIARKCN